jgi:hypothetical protein
VVAALELYTDREVVTGALATPLRLAGVPGAILEGYELDDIAVTLDQAMRGDLHLANRLKVRMRVDLQIIAKKVLDMPATVFARW